MTHQASTSIFSLTLKFWTPFNISGIDEATLFKFCIWIDYGKSHPKNFPW